MKVFKSRGTLGDAFIVNCVIHKMASRGPIRIKQCHSYLHQIEDNWEPPIREIYGLLPNIHVDFVGREEFDALEVPRLHPGYKGAVAEGVCELTPFPNYPLPVPAGLPDDYIAFSPRGGKKNEKHRYIGHDEVTQILRKNADKNIVIVGANPEFANIDGPNVTNLVNKTSSILEAMGVVAGASGFYGIQGLMAYVAVAYKVPSIVYTKSKGYDDAFRNRLMPEWEEYVDIVVHKEAELGR